jgi:hypothetical protein
MVWKRFLNTICTHKEAKRTGTNINTIVEENEEETKNKFSIGTIITKYWGGIPYIGTVTRMTGKYYKIRYEDNDEEELNHSEVRKYAKKNRGEGTTTREVGQRMRLTILLGNWNILASESERMWPFYYSNETDTLYRSYREEWHRNGEFYYDCHTMTDNDTYNYVRPGNVKLLPEDASPTDVMDTDVGWRVSEHLPMRVKETKKTTTVSFMDYVRTQEKHISQYYTQIDFLVAPHEIYEIVKSTKKVNIATDGGAIPLKGSLGFVFADEEGNILLMCHGQPSGNDSLSFRSEICAFLAAVRLVTMLTQYYDDILQCQEPTRSKIQVYTDSLRMIKKLEAYGEYPTAPLAAVLDSEWDVLSALHRALKWFRTYPKVKWVKSHQDDKEYDKNEMPLDAYLNSEADELATTGLKRLQEKPKAPFVGIKSVIESRRSNRVSMVFKSPRARHKRNGNTVLSY